MTAGKAMITGASGGFGAVLARRLAQAGYQVTVVARNEEKLRKLVGELGAGHRHLRADLSDPSQIQQIAGELGREKYALLVNNAAVGTYGKFQDQSLETMQRMMRLNCDAIVTLSHAFLRGAKSGDALVNVASTVGLNGFPGSALYGATKALVISLTEALWYEQKARGIYVMCLCPALMKTEFHEHAGGTDADRPPERMTQLPATVADELLAALRARKKPLVVPGPMNRMMVFASTRVMSRKGAVSMFGGFADQRERSQQQQQR